MKLLRGKFGKYTKLSAYIADCTLSEQSECMWNINWYLTRRFLYDNYIINATNNYISSY